MYIGFELSNHGPILVPQNHRYVLSMVESTGPYLDRDVEYLQCSKTACRRLESSDNAHSCLQILHQQFYFNHLVSVLYVYVYS